MIEIKTKPLVSLDFDFPIGDGDGPGFPLLTGAPKGDRLVVFGVDNGTFSGERLNGTCLGGGDWALIRKDRVLELDVRLTLKTHDDALIYLTYRGVNWRTPDVQARADAGEAIDHTEYYFRTQPWFETGDERYLWLNRLVSVGYGITTLGKLNYELFEVL